MHTESAPAQTRADLPTSSATTAAGKAKAEHVPAAAFVGANGSIGASALWAAVVAQANSGYDLYAVVRPAKVEHFRAHGISIGKRDGDSTVILPRREHPAAIHIVGHLSEVPDGALVFNCVKGGQLVGSLEGVSAKHRLVLFQNGQGHIQRVHRAHPQVAQVHKAVAYVGANQTPDGGVETYGGRIEVGGDKAYVDEIQRLFGGQTVFDVDVVDNIDAASWKKTAMNCALNPLSTIFATTFSGLFETEGLQALCRGVIQEVGQVASVKYPEWRRSADEIADEAYGVFSTTAEKHPDHLSSMQEDFRNGAQTEISALNQYVRDQGAKRGVPTPLNDAVARHMLVFEALRGHCKDLDEFEAIHGDQRKAAMQELLDMVAAPAADTSATAPVATPTVGTKSAFWDGKGRWRDVPCTPLQVKPRVPFMSFKQGVSATVSPLPVHVRVASSAREATDTAAAAS